ncbi:hypothetical protein NX02_p0675 (plasmid) [Sphingomonas sanxanigenens DSM 19645 = NX02]|uniref:Uncharacterized protein n=1 Tax=Sphingomonas sanxanigenens DSM 19645 = NX02 TaxID=1123269 RepID=A0A0F7JQF1_9SPHN|nr:hypothetical protein NX02_p0675 [Sphingomonas sanxanigenens DSM 19645 = NX02]
MPWGGSKIPSLVSPSRDRPRKAGPPTDRDRSHVLNVTEVQDVTEPGQCDRALSVSRTSN